MTHRSNDLFSFLPAERRSARRTVSDAAAAYASAVPPASDPRRACLRAVLATGLLAGAATGLGARPARAASASLAALGAAAQTLAYDGWLESDGQPGTKIARATWRWEPAGGEYRLSMDIDSALIKLGYESSGRLDADGLRPQRYREARKLPMRASRERLLRFRGAAGETPADGEEGERLALPPGGQDRLSAVMQLSLMARAQPARFAPGAEVMLPLASWRSVDEARLAVGRHEPVDVGGRSIDAQRIRRVGAEADQAGIELWLADDAVRTPAVIRFDDDGRGLRFTLAG